MKRLAIAAALLPGAAFATQVGHPAGPNLSYGDISIEHNILSNVTNPAFGASALKDGENEYRMGILNGGVKVEFGKLDDVINQADLAGSALTNTVPSSSFSVTQSGGSITINNGTATHTIDTNAIISNAISSMTLPATDPNYQTELSNSIQTAIEAEINNSVGILANSFLNNIDTSLTPTINALNDNGYLKLGLIAYVPLTPLVITHNALGGSLVLTADISVQGKINYLSSYVKPAASINLSSVTVAGDPTVASNWSVDGTTLNPAFNIASDAAVVTRTAITTELGLGYSRNVLKHDKGDLLVGGRFNFYRVGLGKSYISLMNSTDSEQILQDQMDASLETENGFGIDLGTMWVAENYRVGATINNINAPSFDYKNVSVCSNFSNYVDPSNSANNVNSTVLAECNTTETYSMDPQLRLEAVTSAWNDKLTLGLGYDANAVADPFGTEYQWLTLSAGANLGNWLGLRAGYRSNQADNGLSYATGGLTIFGFNLDGAISKETVLVDGSSTPRSFMVNLSWGISF